MTRKRVRDYERIGKEKVLGDLKRSIISKASGVTAHSGQTLINTLENLIEESAEAVELLIELQNKEPKKAR